MFSCPPKAISNRRYSHIYYSCLSLKPQIRQFYVQNLVFSCLPKSISNRKFSTMLFLPTPENLDSTILFAKRGVLMLSKCISNRRHFSSQPLQGQILSFYVQNAVFWSLPKGILNRWFSNIIYYSWQPLKAEILPFYVQNSVFWGLPKRMSNRRYSHILFLPAPASADSPILCAKIGVLLPCQRHFKYKIFK